ncbi:AI-2E family transporter [Corynebacterium mayonis]|uniref:AI-2E family transporter n=1 Tax=Corynebacterium mayonis TaxID=3062461 RepID=UPI0031405814
MTSSKDKDRATSNEDRRNKDFIGALDTAANPVETFPTPADAAQEMSSAQIDRGEIIAADGRTAAAWALRFIIIVAATALLLYLLKFVWVGILPTLLALIVSTVLWPPVRWLRSKLHAPPALATGGVLIAFFGILAGLISAMAPLVQAQGGELINQGREGITKVVEWAEQRFDIGVIDSDRVQEAFDQAAEFIRGQSSSIASGVMSGLGIVASVGTTLVLTLILTFFFLKDGDRFLPWLRKYAGVKTGWHLTEVLMRSWNTLSGFIRTQAIVSAVDGIFIGIGLIILGIPLWPVLVMLTFFGGFIPIIGAFTAGVLAIAVALVSKGVVTALLVLGLVIIVQQVEGNVLQPILQSKAMGLHAAIVLLSVTVGGTLFGIIGAFLAVPVAAVIAVFFGYWAEMTALRAGEITADDIKIATQQSQTVDSRTAFSALRDHLRDMSIRRGLTSATKTKLGSTRVPQKDEASSKNGEEDTAAINHDK